MCISFLSPLCQQCEADSEDFRGSDAKKGFRHTLPRKLMEMIFQGKFQTSDSACARCPTNGHSFSSGVSDKLFDEGFSLFTSVQVAMAVRTTQLFVSAPVPHVSKTRIVVSAFFVLLRVLSFWPSFFEDDQFGGITILARRIGGFSWFVVNWLSATVCLVDSVSRDLQQRQFF